MRSTARAIARFLYRSALPRGAKNTLRLYLLWDRADRPPGGIEDFAADDVLVLAPHMDDEVIGCGGTLRRHVEAGARVTVIFLTDGRRGDPRLDGDSALTPEQRRTAEQALVEQRKSESRAACELLGVQGTIFCDEPDGALEPTAPVVARVAHLLTTCRPRVIYVPGLLDVHRDHWAANRVLQGALRATSGQHAPALVRQYEAWTPLLVNQTADITPVFELKLRALGAFASQNRTVDYVRTTTGLNTYRAIHRQGGRGYAEAFYESTPQEYLELAQRCAVPP